MHQNICLGSNGVDRVLSLRKFPTRLRGTNICTISARYAPSLYGNQTVQNASKLYETHQNMSLGSNGVDRVRWLRKIPSRLRATNFCTSSARFALSFVRQHNGPKCIQIVQNTPKHEFRVQWGGSGVFVTKNSDVTSWHELLHQVGPFCIECCNATKLCRIHPNSSKCTET